MISQASWSFFPNSFFPYPRALFLDSFYRVFIPRFFAAKFFPGFPSFPALILINPRFFSLHPRSLFSGFHQLFISVSFFRVVFLDFSSFPVLFPVLLLRVCDLCLLLFRARFYLASFFHKALLDCSSFLVTFPSSFPYVRGLCSLVFRPFIYPTPLFLRVFLDFSSFLVLFPVLFPASAMLHSRLFSMDLLLFLTSFPVLFPVLSPMSAIFVPQPFLLSFYPASFYRSASSRFLELPGFYPVLLPCVCDFYYFDLSIDFLSRTLFLQGFFLISQASRS